MWLTQSTILYVEHPKPTPNFGTKALVVVVLCSFGKMFLIFFFQNLIKPVV